MCEEYGTLTVVVLIKLPNDRYVRKTIEAVHSITYDDAVVIVAAHREIDPFRVCTWSYSRNC